MADFMDGESAIARRDYTSALNSFRAAVAKGDERGIGKIATCLYNAGRYKEAVDYCQANISNIQCKLVLGVCYYSGNGIDKNFEKSERLLKGAASEGSKIAKSNLSILFNVMEQYEDEYYWCNEAAMEGFPRAINRLKEIIHEGRGIPSDRYAEYIEHLTESAASKPDDMFKLACHYHYGEFGLPVDHVQAVHWYERASATLKHKAFTNLGTIYERSNQVERDYKKAEEYYKKAVEDNPTFAPAVVNLANLYISDKYGLKNHDEANRLLNTVSLNPDAQAALARLYATGEGEFNDLEKSRDLLKQAADSGSVTALRDLANMYEGDEGQSFRWLNMGAEAGDPVSQVKLGKLCSDVGDYVGALNWLSKATNQGDLEGRELLLSVGEQAESSLFG